MSIPVNGRLLAEWNRLYRWEPAREFLRMAVVTLLAALARAVLAANASELLNPVSWETGLITASAQAVATAILALLPTSAEIT